MKRRTHAQIKHDIQIAESNLSLAQSDYEYLKRACAGFPVVIARLSKALGNFKEEERRFEAASPREQARWKFAGEEQEIMSRLTSSALLRIAERQGIE